MKRRSVWGDAQFRRYAKIVKAIEAGDKGVIAKVRRMSEKQRRLLDKAIHEGWRIPFHSLEIYATRWQDFSGNTHHKAYIYLDDKEVWVSPRAYGYGNSYETRTARDWLTKQGYIPGTRYSNGIAKWQLWKWFHDRLGLRYRAHHDDVKRKKDL